LRADLLGAAAQPNNLSNFPLPGGRPPTLAAGLARCGSSLPVSAVGACSGAPVAASCARLSGLGAQQNLTLVSRLRDNRPVLLHLLQHLAQLVGFGALQRGNSL
jgi:hypothetical protein